MFKNSVIDPPITDIRIPHHFIKCKVRSQNHRLISPYSAIYDLVTFFQGIICVSLCSQIINDEQTARIQHSNVCCLILSLNVLQYLHERCHYHRYVLLHQFICNASCSKTLSSSTWTIKHKPKVLFSCFGVSFCNHLSELSCVFSGHIIRPLILCSFLIYRKLCISEFTCHHRSIF